MRVKEASDGGGFDVIGDVEEGPHENHDCELLAPVKFAPRERLWARVHGTDAAARSMADLFMNATKMYAVLVDIEWFGLAGCEACPSCRKRKTEGHAGDCALADAMRASGGAA